jgi:hypothetical protein
MNTTFVIRHQNGLFLQYNCFDKTFCWVFCATQAIKDNRRESILNWFKEKEFLHFLAGEIVTIEQIYIFPKRTI